MAIKLTQYGFTMDAATVHRNTSYKGHAYLVVSTPRQAVEIHVTPTGIIRISEPRKPYPHELEATNG